MDQENKSKHQWRLGVIVVVFVLAFLVVLVRLFVIQVVDADEYQIAARKQYETQVTIRAERGNIVDRNNTVLATTVDGVSVAYDPEVGQFPLLVAGILSRHAAKDSIAIVQKISGSRSRFVWLVRGAPASLIVPLEALKDRGLIVIHEPRRSYIYDQLGAQVLGLTNIDNRGLSGIELQFDSLLSGKSGFAIMHRDGKGRIRPAISFDGIRAQRGNTVVLTIESDLQRICEYELLKGVVESQSESGCVVAMDPISGDILAMASMPNFNPNMSETVTADAHRIRPITDTYEPGSTFKIITAAALLEENILDTNTMVDGRNGLFIHADGSVVTDGHPLSMVPFSRAFAFSSNVVMATMSQRLRDDVFYKYVRNFGFGLPTDVELPGEVSGFLKKPFQFDGSTKMFMSYGYQLSVTALQLANAYSVIANKGVLMRPRLIKALITEKGTQEFPPSKVRDVVSESTCAKLTRLLCGVVKYGTGTEAAIDGISVAGKTGTAQQVVNGTYSKQNYTASFAGFFPAESPQLVVVVMLDKPRNDIYGGKIAAPIFRRIAQRWLTSRGTPGRASAKSSKDSVTVPDLRGLSEAQVESSLQALRLLLGSVAGEGTVMSQTPEPGLRVPVGTDVSVTLKGATLGRQSGAASGNPTTKPSVIGMTVRRASSVLHAAGYRVRVIGSGVVTSQTWIEGPVPQCELRCSSSVAHPFGAVQ